MIRCRIFKTVPGIVRPMQARMLVTDWHMLPCVPCLVTQLCLTLCDPMDCSPPGSSVHGDSPGKDTGVGCHALIQGIFPTQGLNPGLLPCRWILYQLSHQGSLHVAIDIIKGQMYNSGSSVMDSQERGKSDFVATLKFYHFSYLCRSILEIIFSFFGGGGIGFSLQLMSY